MQFIKLVECVVILSIFFTAVATSPLHSLTHRDFNNCDCKSIVCARTCSCNCRDVGKTIGKGTVRSTCRQIDCDENEHWGEDEDKNWGRKSKWMRSDHSKQTGWNFILIWILRSLLRSSIVLMIKVPCEREIEYHWCYSNLLSIPTSIMGRH